MLKQQRVNTLRPGDPFRDWLIDVLRDRIRNKRCDVSVYRIGPASHIVCRYDFQGEDYGVVAKFYAEPTGWKRDYDPVRSMEKEFETLKNFGQIINVPKAVAARKDFHCVLVTEYVRGEPLFKYMKHERELYDKLTLMAHTLRKLHDHTRSHYRKQDEFAHFHKVLDQLRLDSSTRLNYNRLLGNWWYSTLIDQPYGCMIHSDPNPVNYVFDHDRVYVLDLESSWAHANFIHDLGHFLWHYSKSQEDFYRITRALPFFMSLGLLRMARLGIGPEDSTYIFREAWACLKSLR